MKRKAYVFLIGSLKKGGAERNLSRVASELSVVGHDVHLILFEKRIDYPLHDGVRIIDLDIARYKNKLVKLIMLYLLVVKHIWSIRPYYAIAFTRLSSQFIAITGYPRIIARYDTYPFFFKKRKWISSLLIFNLPNVRKVICPSRDLRQHLERYFVRKSKLKVVYNPVAEMKPEVMDTDQKPENYFILVGRLRTQKQFNIAIEAFAAARCNADYRLVILGEGPEEQRLRQLTASVGMNDKIFFSGFIADPYPMMRKARGLILSSNKEGFPNVVVESLSLGVPVLAADCLTGPAEIVENGVNGFLFPVGDVEQLAALMDRMAYDDALYFGLKSHSKDSVKKFSQDIVFRQWLEVLQ
jgi:glycosyltransferase involved in cell wall biosynthesis